MVVNAMYNYYRGLAMAESKKHPANCSCPKCKGMREKAMKKGDDKKPAKKAAKKK